MTPAKPPRAAASGLTFGSLFAGIGGIDLGFERAGMTCKWQVEIDDYCNKVLAKHWSDVARYGDIRGFSAWVVGINDGLCYNKVCEQTDREKQVYETLSEQKKLKGIEELLISAKIAGNKCPFLQALLKEAGDFVPDIACMNVCEEKTAQMQMVGLGCEEKETQTGREGLDISENKNIEGQKLHSGAGEFLPAIDTHAKNVVNPLKEQINCAPTTSNIGRQPQTKDLIYLMESLYAKPATWKCTRQKATIDVICGGVPCQPASVAGKRRGAEDDRWLWPETFRIVREFRPKWCVFENVPGLLSLEQGIVYDSLLSELESADYEVIAFNIPACAFDAPHRRERIFVLAHTTRERWGRGRDEDVQGQSRTLQTEGSRSGKEQGFLAHADQKRKPGLPKREKTQNASTCLSGQDVGNSKGIGQHRVGQTEDEREVDREIDTPDNASEVIREQS